MESHIVYWVIGGAGGLVLAVIETLLIRALFRAAPPHRLLVVSGRRYRQGHETRGFAVHGGLRAVIPVVERVEEQDTTCVPCGVEVRNAYLKGAVPVTVRWFALVRVSRDPEVVHDAVERFLGRPAAEVGQVATETLEGAARGALAKISPENLDHLTLFEVLLLEGSPPLRAMGLELVHLSIESFGKEV